MMLKLLTLGVLVLVKSVHCADKLNVLSIWVALIVLKNK